MKTSDLIRALAADCASPPKPLRRVFQAALPPAIVAAFALYLAFLGPRPDLMAHLAEPRFAFKFILVLLLMGLAGDLVLRVGQPGAPTRASASRLWIIPVLVGGAILAELLVLPPHLWLPRLIGHNALPCLVSIPCLSLGPLAAIFFSLRQGAPDKPALAGAAAGVFAAAIGAVLYATHCPDDSPLFVAAWYTLAIAFVAGMGALAGARLLRW